MTDPIAQSLADARRVLDEFVSAPATLEFLTRAADLLAARLQAGSKVLICGNGGSSCDAAHFAEELTGRFRNDRPPLAAIACTDVGHITCVANDYGFEAIFSRWVTALGRPGDVLIVLSTSGKSPNILQAVEAAKSGGLATIALMGKGGGPLRSRCDLELDFPGATSDRIQELHMLVLHLWVEAIEARLFPVRG